MNSELSEWLKDKKGIEVWTHNGFEVLAYRGGIDFSILELAEELEINEDRVFFVFDGVGHSITPYNGDYNHDEFGQELPPKSCLGYFQYDMGLLDQFYSEDKFEKLTPPH